MEQAQKFIKKTQWVSNDGWRGHQEPIYWVAGANDTGKLPDSPCPTHVCKEELGLIKSFLKKSKIHYREIICTTSNCFCIHRYLIVKPADFERAKEIVNEFYDTVRRDTILLYVNN